MQARHLTRREDHKFMKLYFAVAAVIIATALSGSLSAQTNEQAPAGTKVDKNDPTTVQPTKRQIQVTPSVIRAVQHKLDEAGYRAGTADGRMGPVTRRAVRKYQRDQRLSVTGKLDESTLSHLNVGGNETMATAPKDLKNGAKAAGHNIKKGHSVAAAKAIGKGIGRAGKAVGEGTKSDVVKGADKVEKKTSDDDAATTPKL
jgi:peptidoglycan hydrolase-like protein with peptidoglycan-binding domain